jgi:glycosyltransferase involved in cell wall biosynthesis
MKIAIVTDAWHPQVNGVVRTIEATNRELALAGHETIVLSPLSFRTLACPGYPEIRLSLLPYRRMARLLREAAPDALHIATEGPLGTAARRYCLRRGLPFTTAYHTRFPQYLKAMYGVPESWTYRFLRWFHGRAERLLTPTPHVERELADWGITNIARWTRGVDLDVFQPVEPSLLLQGLPRPIFLCVGRVSVEKNIDAFLDLDLPGTKVVAGVGPELEALKRRHPETHFVGVLSRPELAQLYSGVDAFVFPSRTDTFGLVLLEALACGTPVAAYPVQGPLDVVGGSAVAVLDEDLRKAALSALRIDRSLCRAHAERYSWRAATLQFLEAQPLWHGARAAGPAAPAAPFPPEAPVPGR